MTSPKPAAGDLFPAIELSVLNGTRRSLAQARDGYDWLLNVVYRGKHCPVCTGYLRNLNAVLPELKGLGVDVLAMSADNAERAQLHMQEVEPDFDVGCCTGLSVAQMQSLGPYISGPRNGMNVAGPFCRAGVVHGQRDRAPADCRHLQRALRPPRFAEPCRGVRFLRGLAEPYPVNGSFA